MRILILKTFEKALYIHFHMIDKPCNPQGIATTVRRRETYSSLVELDVRLQMDLAVVAPGGGLVMCSRISSMFIIRAVASDNSWDSGVAPLHNRTPNQGQMPTFSNHLLQPLNMSSYSMPG